ncbi:MAG TPA: hypothetical protein VJM81_09935 [Rhizorhapis sp.]|uniref:hypothetical protein n=1 Tax=Rhizorhapis sp. TaxID=1968842 RepID=UPI002B473713|nr:hypothetical protein [Rhizorhapis sp.]HKX23579.1 hypothetical protein [Rhizorhapis sp.]
MEDLHIQDLSANLSILLNAHRAISGKPTDQQTSEISRLSGVACASIIRAMAAACKAQKEATH